MPCLRIKTGLNKGKVYEIATERITIGRDDTQTIPVQDQGVSRQHAEIFRIGNNIFVRDLGSTNGTFLNHESITEESLAVGDELLIGTTVLLVEKSENLDLETGQEEEGEEGEKAPTTTIELKVDETAPVSTDLKTLEVDSRNLRLSFEIERILHTAGGSSEAMIKVLQLMGDALHADGGALYLMEGRSGKLTRKASLESAGSLEDRVSRTIVKRSLSSGRPILTSDATMDERFKISDSVVLKKIRSVISAPILMNGRACGLFYFYRNRIGASFAVEDLELATAAALQMTMLLTNQNAKEKLERGMLSTIRALVTAMEIGDPRGQGHAQRVADYSVAIGMRMGLHAHLIQNLRLAALLHDVGKLAERSAGKDVSKEQQKEQHVYAGEKILRNIDGFEDILPGIRYHHERADGNGFPYKVTNDKTPLMARILIVTNAFDNSCTHGGLGAEGLAAKDVLKDMGPRGGTEFDNDVIKALLVCHRDGTLYNAV